MLSVRLLISQMFVSRVRMRMLLAAFRTRAVLGTCLIDNDNSRILMIDEGA